MSRCCIATDMHACAERKKKSRGKKKAPPPHAHTRTRVVGVRGERPDRPPGAATGRLLATSSLLVSAEKRKGSYLCDVVAVHEEGAP
jgi:hypothetical protein